MAPQAVPYRGGHQGSGQATPDGILLKPVIAALIKQGRGILKPKPGGKPLAEDLTEHKKAEKEVEDRHAR